MYCGGRGSSTIDRVRSIRHEFRQCFDGSPASASGMTVSSEASSEANAKSDADSYDSSSVVLPPNQDSDGNLITTAAKAGGTLTIGTTQNPSVIGYMPEITGNSLMHFTRCAYESLLYYDNDGNIIGQLVSDWKEDPEEPSITFTLQQGVKFSDGRAIQCGCGEVGS